MSKSRKKSPVAKSLARLLRERLEAGAYRSIKLVPTVPCAVYLRNDYAHDVWTEQDGAELYSGRISSYIIADEPVTFDAIPKFRKNKVRWAILVDGVAAMDIVFKTSVIEEMLNRPKFKAAVAKANEAALDAQTA